MVVLVLSVIGGLGGLVSVDGPGEATLALLSLASTAVAMAGLAKFLSTDWYAWQRTKPSVHEGAPIGQLVAIGVLVGALGGLTGPVVGGFNVGITVGDRYRVPSNGGGDGHESASGTRARGHLAHHHGVAQSLWPVVGEASRSYIVRVPL